MPPHYSPVMSNQTQAVENLSPVEAMRLAHLKDMARSTSGVSHERYMSLLASVESGATWLLATPCMRHEPNAIRPVSEQERSKRQHIDVRPSQEPVNEPDVPAHKVERWIDRNLGMSEIRERGEAYIAHQERQERQKLKAVGKVRHNRRIANNERVAKELGF